jgi:Na+/H+ antiporter NhaD/arsenite permease-like protein
MHDRLDLTATWFGFLALAVFFVAYLLVATEAKTHLKKSKPVILSAGIIWALIGVAYLTAGSPANVGDMVRHNVMEFGELFLFILAAMTYVNTMEERRIFDALRSWLVRRRFTLRKVFWITGVLSFFLSAALDNMTTALVMGAVVITVGSGNTAFIAIACINVVVAANAGGAWSPFGDITTLMVWQAGKLEALEFLELFVPSAVNWFIPAFIMSFAIPKALPSGDSDHVKIREGGMVIVGLFALTIVMAVSFYNVLKLPPFLGMMTGLGMLNIYGWVLRGRGLAHLNDAEPLAALEPQPDDVRVFDIFEILQRVEWDTLMFFYGIILSVGGLGTIGYLIKLSDMVYVGLGPTIANTIIGAMSAIVDNIPVMFAVLSMNPALDRAQWLLVTLTCGVGGSILSIGSAAGVALMGQSRGMYTFGSHLKWSWAIALGYIASILVHLLINGS